MSAEQFMTHRKAILFGDTLNAAAILATDDPREAKRLGRRVAGYDEHRRVAARLDIVIEANLAKFAQNADLRSFLLSTADRLLVEASPSDAVWGIGLSRAEAERTPADQWPGLNLLDRALMRVRDQLRHSS